MSIRPYKCTEMLAHSLASAGGICFYTTTWNRTRVRSRHCKGQR